MWSIKLRKVKIFLFNQAQVTSLVMTFMVCYNMVYVPFYSEKKKKKAERKTLQNYGFSSQIQRFPSGSSEKGPSPGNSLRSDALVASSLFHMGQLTWTFQSLLMTNIVMLCLVFLTCSFHVLECHHYFKP